MNNEARGAAVVPAWQAEMEAARRWIREDVCRVDNLMPATLLPLYLSFRKAFLHLRLRPRYEG